MEKISKNRIPVIVALLGVLSFFLYITHLDPENEFIYHLDILFQSLYFIPVVLACLWLRINGGLLVSLIVVILMIPNMVLHWEGFSAMDLNRILQKITYILLALVLGKAIEIQRREQKHAREAERLAAVGRSMAAVAHDLKTPLVAIGGFSRQLRRQMPEGQSNLEKMDIIISEVGRMEAMVGDLAAFSKPLRIERAETDITGLIRNVLEIAENKARERRVKLRSEVPKPFPSLNIDTVRIQETLLNLVINAVEASPEDETVIVRASAKGRTLILEVIDRGHGIPPDQREEIFLPFYTTKKEGMGLGLANSKKIIESHGGTLVITDNPGKGTTFRAVLPDSVKR